ncbi:unnamed protein product [Phytophthora fragariaefolia]|uniref:Unnamed protein product n=1 Tax=Phytophthora fragariaefolia TaxID=1490495 RepID=A0A9W6Y9H7_9STRA|nr:unnamed protein product [Phytophthora fragariaefolia]
MPTDTMNGSDNSTRTVSAEVKGLVDLAIQLKKNLETGELVLPSSQTAREVDGLLRKINKLGNVFSGSILRHENSVVAFSESIGILVELIWRCPCGSLDHQKFNGLLKKLPGIIENATQRATKGHFTTHLTLAASYD